MTVHHQDPWLTVHVGDCRAVLATMEPESVHTVVTSPPYWGLRSYGIGTDHGELGLESNPDQYVSNMVAVFREVRRVLRPDGTLWLNLGDSYAASSNTGGTNSIQGSAKRVGAMTSKGHGIPTGLKPKDLVGIPWRVAFALQADGWYLRSDIIWSKPNPMPESVTDRPTKAHEYLFLLAKSERYYFDADAVREDFADERMGNPGIYRSKHEGAKSTTLRNDGDRIGKGWDKGEERGGRNIRSVWTIATQPYPGAHFATFPPKLVEPCILAGTSERGVCPECGAPWRRMVERTVENRVARVGHVNLDRNDSGASVNADRTYTTTGWKPTCTHDAEPVPATVLDPFGGSGTTAMVAQHLSRRAVLIDLNPDYIDQQLKRNQAMPLGLEAA
jgi:DNA modification methylase